jgi:hypothetical protein
MRRRGVTRDYVLGYAMARKHMARELSDTRARLDAMLQQLREELAQLTQQVTEGARHFQRLGRYCSASPQLDATKVLASWGSRRLRRRRELPLSRASFPPFRKTVFPVRGGSARVFFDREATPGTFAPARMPGGLTAPRVEPRVTLIKAEKPQSFQRWKAGRVSAARRSSLSSGRTERRISPARCPRMRLENL